MDVQIHNTVSETETLTNWGNKFYLGLELALVEFDTLQCPGKKMASIGRRYAPNNGYDDMMIIIDIPEPPAFQKHSTYWVF